MCLKKYVCSLHNTHMYLERVQLRGKRLQLLNKRAYGGINLIMCMYVYICVCVYIHMCVCMCVSMDNFFMSAPTARSTCSRVCLCVHVHVMSCVYVCIYVQLLDKIYIYIYVCYAKDKVYV